MDEFSVRMSVIGAAVYRMEQHVSLQQQQQQQQQTSYNNNKTDSSINSSINSSKTISMSTNTCVINHKQTCQLNSEDIVIAAALHGIAYDECATDTQQKAQVGVTTTTDHAIANEALQFDNNGTGRILGLQQYRLLEHALSQLQVSPESIVKLQDTPIGRGGFAKVYKVMLQIGTKKRVCAAKVCMFISLTTTYTN
jgi:hypothetical protein